MIVKTNNINKPKNYQRTVFNERLYDIIIKDESLVTLKIEKNSLDFILHRISELAEKIIGEETEILLNNSHSQYISLKNQYNNLEKLYQEV